MAAATTGGREATTREEAAEGEKQVLSVTGKIRILTKINLIFVCLVIISIFNVSAL